ncbi:PAS domain S-box protein [Haladaptatus sp. AB643]|uniref:PAS domain S-box protein n=2 Tax=unclassified Haladaptatus TaxID=2622732 RepID=UPI00209C6A09|nr:PAS domain S-box protein [Haladaptatus sp. AB643]MCO8245564.1 PAS domain S-box protein [Haladaptatus sp. AB643]
MAPIVVLHVDDDPDVLDLAATSLEGKSNQLRLRTASSGDDALSILREGGIDCVVSEYEMPDTTGISLLESVREEFPDLPFILFTGTGSETVASRAISAGITDYLQKEISVDGYAILANRIESVVHSARTERALQESEERYRTVVEGSHDAVYIYQDDRFAFVNERACEITGYTADELRGMDVWSLLHPDDQDRVRTIAENRMNGRHEVSTYDARFRTKDGEIRYGNFSVRATTYRGTTATIGSVRDVTERKRTESWLQALIDHSRDIVTLLDETGTIVYESPAVERLGYDQDELEGDVAFEYIHPDDRVHAAETFFRAIENPEVTPTLTYRFQHADGSWRYLETTGENHLDTTSVKGLVLNSRDVTEQVRMKEERDEILSRMTDAFLAFDEEWRFTYVNEQAEEILNRTAPEIIDEVVWDVFPEAVETRFYDDNHEAMRVQEPMTFEAHFEPFDSWFEVNVYPSSNGVSVYLRDVTERKNRETTLEALHNATRTLMQAETSAAVSEIAVRVARDVLDLPVTAIWDCEDSTVRLVARTEQHRAAYGESVPEADREAIADAFEANETVVRKLHYGDVGSEAFVPLGARGVMSFAAERLDDFDVYHAQLLAANTAAALDRAEREDERTAHQRELERQNERLEEFASVVSHDLRNPLNVAQGYLDMYRSTGKREHLTHVERAHERMANIVKDVLTLARQGRTVNETRPISGETVATDAWASVETGPATLDSSWDSIIDADASRLQQLLENLFRNALDHGRPDVTIRVGELTGVVENGGLRQKTATGGAAAGFFVEDDGPGIPEAARKTVFESGYSTAEFGTGLGLTIVRQIAEAHGWEVSLVTADDGGARFEFAGVEPVNE